MGTKGAISFVCHPLTPLTTGPWVLDGDEDLGQALRLSSNTVIGVGVAVLAANRLVGAVAFNGVTGTAGIQLLHDTHRVEETLLLTLLWKRELEREEIHLFLLSTI